VEFGSGRLVRSENTRISGLTNAGGLSWTQHDAALPFWLNLTDPLVNLVVESSDFVRALDQQTVKVTGLTGSHVLSIDGKTVGTFSAEDLAAGINLATFDTPMRAQASRVHDLVRKRTEAHNQRWRNVQTHGLLGNETVASKEKMDVIRAYDKYDAALDKEARRVAQPTPHRFTLMPAP